MERKVPVDGVIMVARQRLRVGRTYAGEIVTVHVEDTYFRVTLNRADVALHPRKNQHPVTRFRAKITELPQNSHRSGDGWFWKVRASLQVSTSGAPSHHRVAAEEAHSPKL
ncbi:hypothetical protein ABT187_48225 [Streptomyces sp. NPDC001817]|uniref:hypothetical protein n=1 Tax=Streptomyces sp. NPDC001817 TaxID=3154398 RepID=UPI003318798F